MAGQTKPISPALITALDQSSYANKLGVKVGRKAKLFTDEKPRLVCLKSSAADDALYSAAHMRGFATATLIGFKDRTPELRERNVVKELEAMMGGKGNINKALERVVDRIVKVLDYAYKTVPGWRDLRRVGADGLSPKEFRLAYLHGSPAGLYVIGGALGAAWHCGVDPRAVIDAIAKLKWRRDDTEQREGDDGVIKLHPFFEDTLIRNEKIVDPSGDIKWVLRTTGGARTN